ncbi:hypothetical protein OAT67_07600 [Bacteriovoracaceae bacterium]|nr:hypothetical protein [Bacteriovoracaceae bacterium]
MNIFKTFFLIVILTSTAFGEVYTPLEIQELNREIQRTISPKEPCIVKTTEAASLSLSLRDNLKGSYPTFSTFQPNKKIEKLAQQPTMEEFLLQVSNERALKEVTEDLNKLSYQDLYDMLSEEQQIKLTELVKELEITDEELATIHWDISENDEELSIRLVEQFVDPALNPEEPHKKWRIQVYGGISSVQSMLAILGGDTYLHTKPEVGIAGIEVGRTLVNRFRGSNWDIEATVGASHYFDKESGSGNSVNGAIRFVYNTSVHGSRTYFSLSEGLSYADTPPSTESSNPSGEQSNLLNYIKISAGINIGDLLKKSSLKNCYTGASIEHRSGVFGTVDAFGNVYGGSNFMTIFLECRK